jgi:hypothetical protein
MDVHTHNLRINLPHTLSLFTCADEQIKAGGYVRVKLTGLVHAYRLFTLPFDHVFDDGYDCVQDTQMSELLLLCTINAKSSIFVWHEYIAPREIKSARTMGGNTPPAKRRKRLPATRATAPKKSRPAAPIKKKNSYVI